MRPSCITLFLYGDKCKYIDVRNIINVQVNSCFFLAPGPFEDKTREKGLVNFYIFQQPLLCLRQNDLKTTQTDERKDTKDYIKVSLV